MSLSQPTALGPTAPSLHLLAALLQNPACEVERTTLSFPQRQTGQQRRELKGEYRARGTALSLLWHPVHFSWGRHPFLMVQRVIPSEPSSLLYPALFALQPSPQPRGGTQSWAPSVAALEFWVCRRCCILPVPHALQRQLHSDREFPAHFIFMQAYMHINCQQLWRRGWQGSRGEELMLHQALLLSPSGAGLEDTTAMCGDGSQLQRAPVCRPSQEEPGKVTPSSPCSPLQGCTLITWALHSDCTLGEIRSPRAGSWAHSVPAAPEHS